MTRISPLSPMTDWMQLSAQAWMLWGEASSVIWLRSWKLAQGGSGASQEALRMVSEKVEANMQLGMEMMARPLEGPKMATRRSLRHYRSKVRANQRRLTS
ncbi:MAG: hypothetical protein ACKOPO_14045 [Novosphingobium sp.]